MKLSEVFPQRMLLTASKVAALARRAADLFPLTALGCAVALLSVVALISFGYGKLDLVLLVLGYGVVGLLVLAVLAVTVSALALRAWSRRRASMWSMTKLETGRALPTGFSLPSLWWFPLIQVRWDWVDPTPATVSQSASHGRLEEQVALGRRGIFDRVIRRIVVQDAFGLARLAFRQEQSGPLEVLPHVGGLRRLPVLTSLTGGDEFPHPMGLEDGDRVELRRYVPGDSARFIHWKVFGRTRRLMVRVPERALSRARRTVAYLVAGADDEAAAAAARAAVEEGALGVDWELGADGAPEPTSSDEQALHKIMASSHYKGPSGSGLPRFLAEIDGRGPAALVVFAPPRMGPWVDEVRAVSGRRYGRIRVVIGVDAVHEVRPRSAWHRWLLTPQGIHGVPREGLELLGRALSQLRCEVVIIDRVSGRVLGDGVHLSLLERRAA